MPTTFSNAIEAYQGAFGIELADDRIAVLDRYFELIQEHNPLLHLVAPCSAEEFAVRHVLESLMLLEYLPPGSSFADVGTGAGLPSIPCLIVRNGLSAQLIESKEKKARFLSQAFELLGIADRAVVVNKQFSETQPGGSQLVTCRALDKLIQRVPALLKWAGRRRLLLFGGENLAAPLQGSGRNFVQKLIPLSERRYLYVEERSA